jgi:cytidylate kinase
MAPAAFRLAGKWCPSQAPRNPDGPELEFRGDLPLRDDLTSDAAPSSVAAVACTVVCVSHATGSGGDEIGRQVAERLGYLYVDEEIVANAAAQGGVGPGDVADEERRKSLASRVLEAIAEGGEGWALASTMPVAVEGLSSSEIRGLIRETVAQTVARGKVVIVAHAASFVVQPGPESLRVLVTASPQTRAKRISGEESLDEARALGAVKEADAGRRDYLKRFYGVDRESPTHYDLVINTDVLSPERAADIISRAASR